MLLSGSSAAVTDFGIAKAISASRGPEADAGSNTPLTQLGTSLGTPGYMSPEQAAGDEVDHRADLYSWGMMAYEMIAGVHPFAHRRTAQQLLAAQIAERPAPLRDRRPDCPPPLAALVMQCLEKSAAARPMGASAVLSMLDVPGTAGVSGARSWLSGPRLVGAVVALLAVAAVSWLAWQRSRINWARGEAIPEINQMADAGRFEDGFRLATRALRILPDDSAVVRATARVSSRFALASPAGVRVYRQPYAVPDAVWQLLGTTPLDTISIPAGWSRMKVENEGFQPYLFASVNGNAPRSIELLGNNADKSSDFVTVNGGRQGFTGTMPGLGYLPARTLAAFQIGRYEVTNKGFKRFVDSGGYRRRELWVTDIRRNGRPITWADAMKGFVDRTGRPGPATWDVGDYPKDQAEHPVTGISWYEASAYARFVGKKLPTAYHWVRAAAPNAGAFIIPLSNTDGKGLAPVGQFHGMSPSGAFDVAGNAREWVQNASGHERFLLGGAYNDPAYMFYMSNHQDAFDRSPENGFRLASYEDDSASVLEASLDRHLRSFEGEQPVSDAVFSVYRRLYDYDGTPLEARIERTDTTDDFIRQRITFAAAYGGERVIAHMFLPRTGTPPYQTVVHFPGAGSIGNAVDEPMIGQRSYLVKSGRAVLLPIYKSTQERRDALAPGNWYPNASNFYREHVVMWAKDLERSVDYLHTRSDVDTTRLAYFGTSWGGYQSGIMLAVETRFKAAVLNCPGLAYERPQAEVDQVNFLPRIRTPVVMVSGKYDAIFPLETSAQPMFRLWGTPAEHKRQVVGDWGHCPPADALVREGLAWLDKYLGPVR